MKKSILLFILVLSISGIQAQEASSTTLRKGIHLGAHVTPGFGTILTNAYENLAVDYGMTAGLDMNIYINDMMGIHTGVSYLLLPWKYKFDFENLPEVDPREITASVKAVGIPIKYLLTTGKKTVGFYLEAGFAFYFPVSYSSSRENQILETVTVMFAPELTAGMNIRANDLVSFNISAFSSSQMPVFRNNINNEITSSIGTIYGLKLGMMFRLTK